jgi:hypothetical protein
VDQPIVAFRQDEAGTWVAELACGHTQHIRHNPPFRLAPWVLDDEERNARIGADIECGLCDQAEPS